MSELDLVRRVLLEPPYQRILEFYYGYISALIDLQEERYNDEIIEYVNDTVRDLLRDLAQDVLLAFIRSEASVRHRTEKE